MGIFISHATADKSVVDAFVDLLQTGLNIPQEDIFCSSLEGLSIPQGSNFADFIASKLGDAKFVIAILTPTYYERPFCLCELGATWIIQHNFFPVLVPPLEFKDLKAVLAGVQSARIDDKSALNDLRDRLIGAGWKTGKTSRWEVKRDEFLEKMKGITISNSGIVSADKHSALEEKYLEAQTVIREKNDEINELTRLIDALKKCKDRKDVEQTIKENTAETIDAFEQLIEDFNKATAKLPRVVIEALFHEYRHEDWNPRLMGNDDLWESLERAKERGFLEFFEERGIKTTSHKLIKSAKQALSELANFLDSGQSASSEFINNFDAEHEYSLDFENRDFWEDYLGL